VRAKRAKQGDSSWGITKEGKTKGELKRGEAPLKIIFPFPLIRGRG